MKNLSKDFQSRELKKNEIFLNLIFLDHKDFKYFLFSRIVCFLINLISLQYNIEKQFSFLYNLFKNYLLESLIDQLNWINCNLHSYTENSFREQNDNKQMIFIQIYFGNHCTQFKFFIIYFPYHSLVEITNNFLLCLKSFNMVLYCSNCTFVFSFFLS